MKNDPIKKARTTAYRLLAKRARTVKQRQDTFQRQKIPVKVSEQVIDELLAAGYLDDSAYAQQFIEYQVTNKQRGPLWLRAALLRAGVERELINQALSAVFNPELEEILAEKYLTKICLKSNVSPQKAMRRLLSRGFSAQTARQVTAKIIGFSAGPE
jgi:regulatory protein